MSAAGLAGIIKCNTEKSRRPALRRYLSQLKTELWVLERTLDKFTELSFG